MPVWFHLQADRLEGQVKSSGIGVDARSKGHSGPDEPSASKVSEPVNNLGSRSA